jgi:hypothetical protein
MALIDTPALEFKNNFLLECPFAVDTALLYLMSKFKLWKKVAKPEKKFLGMTGLREIFSQARRQTLAGIKSSEGRAAGAPRPPQGRVEAGCAGSSIRLPMA